MQTFISNTLKLHYQTKNCISIYLVCCKFLHVLCFCTVHHKCLQTCHTESLYIHKLIFYSSGFFLFYINKMCTILCTINNIVFIFKIYDLLLRKKLRSLFTFCVHLQSARFRCCMRNGIFLIPKGKYFLFSNVYLFCVQF